MPLRILIINFEMDRLSRAIPYAQQVVNLLAQRCEQVVVMTSRVGSYDKPDNVHLELIPARPWGLPQRLGGTYLVNLQAYRLIKQHRIDACFIHMAAHWSYELQPAFRLTGTPLLVWFAHGVITPQTRRSVMVANRVITPSPESCRVEAKHIHVIGHGIDTDIFNLPPMQPQRNSVISVSRITPRKRIDLLVDVIQALRAIPGAPSIDLQMIGTIGNEGDQPYDHVIRERIWNQGLENIIHMKGYVPQKYIPHFYRSAFLHINFCEQCAMDKTLLEALACGCPVLTSSEPFFDLLKDYPEFIVKDLNPDAIARQVLEIYHKRDSYDRAALRNLIVGRHDIHSYVGKIMSHLEELVAQRRL